MRLSQICTKELTGSFRSNLGNASRTPTAGGGFFQSSRSQWTKKGTTGSIARKRVLLAFTKVRNVQTRSHSAIFFEVEAPKETAEAETNHQRQCNRAMFGEPKLFKLIHIRVSPKIG